MSDDLNLLEVTYVPYYMNNETILNGKCPPGWDLVGDTCYIYVGAPMTFEEARAFCRVSFYSYVTEETFLITFLLICSPTMHLYHTYWETITTCIHF